MGAPAKEVDRVRHVVSNTGPVLHLSEAQVLDLLSRIGEVHIPKAVDTEMAQHHPDWQTRAPDWVIVDTLIAPHDEEAKSWQQAG